MTITLAIRDANGEYRQNPHVLLDDELLSYLRQLTQFPSLRDLADVDPYSESKVAKALHHAVDRELQCLAWHACKKNIPPPPEHVGLEDGDEPDFGEPFGWEGLSRFIEECRALFAEADSEGCDLVAIGD